MEPIGPKLREQAYYQESSFRGSKKREVHHEIASGRHPHLPGPGTLRGTPSCREHYFKLMEAELKSLDRDSLKSNPGAMLAAAVLYAKQHPANPSFGDKKKLELALQLGDLLAGQAEKDTAENKQDYEWEIHFWLDTYRLLENDLGPSAAPAGARRSRRSSAGSPARWPAASTFPATRGRTSARAPTTSPSSPRPSTWPGGCCRTRSGKPWAPRRCTGWPPRSRPPTATGASTPTTARPPVTTT